MLVNEMYRAVQGEGPWAGVPCVMLRLHGCPVKCAWCDTAFTWKGKERGRQVAVEEVAQEVRNLLPGRKHLVVTGGEPMLQVQELPALVQHLADWYVEIETSGVFEYPSPAGWLASARWNVSPKMPSAVPRKTPDEWVVASFLRGNSVFKFVVADDTDLTAAEALVARASIPVDLVWLMAEGSTRARQADALAWLFDVVVSRGLPYRISPRMQVQAFGVERGR